MANSFPPLSPYATGLRCRCPRCGTGRLFGSLLTVADRCTHCDLGLSAQESGDGPAVFVIFIIGPIVTGLAFWLEMSVAPPLWLHVVLWFPMITIGSIALLRPFKAVLVALQYRHKAGEPGTRTIE